MDAERRLPKAEIAMEYAALGNEHHCPKGMYIIPSTESLFVWDGVLFVHQGYYADAVLKFRVQFPLNYPASPPAVTFITDVFHPLIETDTRTLNVKQRFSSWRPKQDHIFHLLHWIKAIFKKDVLNSLEEGDCLNKEAFRLYRNATQSFAALAHQSAMLSQSSPTLYENSETQGAGTKSHGIVFRDPDHDGIDIDTLRKQMGLTPWAISLTSNSSDTQSESQASRPL